jgi:hypothetical protein
VKKGRAQMDILFNFILMVAATALSAISMWAAMMTHKMLSKDGDVGALARSIFSAFIAGLILGFLFPF